MDEERKLPGFLKEMESNFNTYKSCFVPTCKNTSIKTPRKIFLSVPSNQKRFEKWCEIVGRKITKRRSFYCCEDHFDMKNDLENYMHWLHGGGYKRLKKNVVPRLGLNSVNYIPQLSEANVENTLQNDGHECSSTDSRVLAAMNCSVDKRDHSQAKANQHLQDDTKNYQTFEHVGDINMIKSITLHEKNYSLPVLKPRTQIQLFGNKILLYEQKIQISEIHTDDLFVKTEQIKDPNSDDEMILGI